MRKSKKDSNGISEFELLFLSIWFQNGYNGSEAYRIAKPGCADTTARTEASKILAKPNIEDEIARRKLELAKKSEIRLDSMVGTLKNLMHECISDNDRTNLLKTIDQLNKMAGFYKQKIDITSGGEKISINLNLNDDIE